MTVLQFSPHMNSNLSNSTDMAQKTSILRVLMPVVSLLILCYYVISFPLSFGGDGGPSNAQASLGKPFNIEDLKNNEFGAGKNAVLSKREEFVDIVNSSTGIANNVESDQEMDDNGHKFRDPVVESKESLNDQFDSQETDEPAEGDFPDGSFLGEDLFHSPDIFRRNYKEMEDKFKIYIYPDGDPNTFYQTPRKLTGKYASEGYFFQNLPESKFYTTNADEAHLFFIPISCHKMRGKGTSYEKMTEIVEEYVGILRMKYPYWNRTLGADHFFVTCHDVGARATEKVLHLVKNSIRVVCSPSYNGDFIPHKDVSMPQILQPFALPRGGNDTSNRTVLGFWAGHRNSRIRVVLAKLWENDTVLAISNNRINRAIGELVYQKQYYKTKFCICPGGSQVNSARIADSIHYGCIPVILSDYYDLPFNDVLNWRNFALLLREKDVYDLKYILQSITDEQYHALHKGLLQVQNHFEWHTPPQPYDTFHMVIYELWLRHHAIQYKK